jgi:RNA polymerase sigma factor (sigma-70 family)
LNKASALWIDASLDDRLRLQEVLFPQGLVWDGTGFQTRLRACPIYCWGSEERRDLIQEITMQLSRAFPSYDEKRVFSTWMYRIALNVAISSARKAGRRRLVAPLENSDIGSVAGLTKPEPDERIDALYRSLRGLDPFNRALMMLYLDDRSYLEIADVLGISETNVATKISRLKQRLRSELAPAVR